VRLIFNYQRERLKENVEELVGEFAALLDALLGNALRRRYAIACLLPLRLPTNGRHTLRQELISRITPERARFRKRSYLDD
jgi:hypothetical protein